MSFETAPTYEQSTDIDKIAFALAEAQSKLETLSRDKSVKTPKYQFRYTDLASVWEMVRPVLRESELAVIQSPSRSGNAVEVVTQIVHSSGQWVRGRISMPADSTAQGVGSAITYARRYALSSMLGVATEDDDGKAARGNGSRPTTERPLPMTNKPALVGAFRDKLGIDPEVLERYLGHSLENIDDDEESTLVAFGKAIGQGNEEARRELCGPSPVDRMREEMEGAKE